MAMTAPTQLEVSQGIYFSAASDGQQKFVSLGSPSWLEKIAHMIGSTLIPAFLIGDRWVVKALSYTAETGVVPYCKPLTGPIGPLDFSSATSLAESIKSTPWVTAIVKINSIASICLCCDGNEYPLVSGLSVMLDISACPLTTPEKSLTPRSPLTSVYELLKDPAALYQAYCKENRYGTCQKIVQDHFDRVTQHCRRYAEIIAEKAAESFEKGASFKIKMEDGYRLFFVFSKGNYYLYASVLPDVIKSAYKTLSQGFSVQEKPQAVACLLAEDTLANDSPLPSSVGAEIDFYKHPGLKSIRPPIFYCTQSALSFPDRIYHRAHLITRWANLGSLSATTFKGCLPVLDTLIYQLLEKTAIMHEAGIVHRDYKLPNLVVARTGTNTYELWIIDFGTSASATEKPYESKDYLNLVPCRGSNLSPEMLIKVAPTGGYSWNSALSMPMVGESTLTFEDWRLSEVWVTGALSAELLLGTDLYAMLSNSQRLAEAAVPVLAKDFSTHYLNPAYRSDLLASLPPDHGIFGKHFQRAYEQALGTYTSIYGGAKPHESSPDEAKSTLDASKTSSEGGGAGAPISLKIASPTVTHSSYANLADYDTAAAAAAAKEKAPTEAALLSSPNLLNPLFFELLETALGTKIGSFELNNFYKKAYFALVSIMHRKQEEIRNRYLAENKSRFFTLLLAEVARYPHKFPENIAELLKRLEIIAPLMNRNPEERPSLRTILERWRSFLSSSASASAAASGGGSGRGGAAGGAGASWSKR